jgi:hypothetical protein
MNFSGISFFILENSEIQFLLSINKLCISWQLLKFVLFDEKYFVCKCSNVSTLNLNMLPIFYKICIQSWSKLQELIQLCNNDIDSILKTFILENSEIQFLLSINKLYISWQLLKFILFESQISFIVRKLLCRNEVNPNINDKLQFLNESNTTISPDQLKIKVIQGIFKQNIKPKCQIKWEEQYIFKFRVDTLEHLHQFL